MLTLQPHQWYCSDIFVTFLYVFLVTYYIFWPLAPPRGMTLGQRYHTLKGLNVGKCQTKFQLSSPEGIKVISYKRNADVNLHLNLQVNLNLVTNVTYAHTHVTARRKAICPTPAKDRRGHKKPISTINSCYFKLQGKIVFVLTLVMLNKLRYHAHF